MVRRNRTRGRVNRRATRNGGMRNGRNRLHYQLFGGKVRARRNPSSKVSEPWNTMNVQYRHDVADSTEAKYTAKALGDYIRAQNGLPATQKFDMRLVDCAVTDLAGRALILVTCDHRGHYYQEITDFPGRNSWASCKWRWPASDQVQPWASDEDTIPVATAVTGVTLSSDPIKEHKSILVQFTVLWRLPGVTSGPLAEILMRNRHIVSTEKNMLQLRSIDSILENQEVQSEKDGSSLDNPTV